jgi:hypothetical protein
VPKGSWVHDVLITDQIGIALAIAGDNSKRLSLAGPSSPQAGPVRDVPSRIDSIGENAVFRRGQPVPGFSRRSIRGARLCRSSCLPFGIGLGHPLKPVSHGWSTIE